jgi:hypothetical protein
MNSIENIRKDITLSAVSDEGYNQRDMHSYYVGTYLLYKQELDYTVVYCTSAEETGTMRCDVYDIDGPCHRKEIPIHKLFRFTPRQGYYLSEYDGVFSYSLPTTRSYKKGINRDLLRIHSHEDGDITRVADQCSFLGYICSEPVVEPRGESFLISQRLAVHNGKIYSFYQDKTVGSYIDGVLVTPFTSILDRVNQLHGDIECQLQTL